MKRALVLGFAVACGMMGDPVLRKAADADAVDIHESYDREGKQLFVHLERRAGKFTYRSSLEEKGGASKTGDVSAAVVDGFLRAVSKSKRGAKEEMRGARWEKRRIEVSVRPRGGASPIELEGTNATWRADGYLLETAENDALDTSYDALITSIERPALP